MKQVAIRVRARAHAFRCEVFRASIIASFEKNPARNGAPARARVPTVMQEVEKGARLKSPPIFRMSCSLAKRWISEPEHRKSMALKKAWVEI